MKTSQNQSFVFHRVAWHEVSKQIQTAPIAEAINNNIDLYQYGTSVQKIEFTFLAVQPTNAIHENTARYIKKDKTIEIALKLSYPHLTSANQEKIFQIMAALFLVSIDLYHQFDLEDFNIKAFKADVEKVFQSKAWLQSVSNR